MRPIPPYPKSRMHQLRFLCIAALLCMTAVTMPVLAAAPVAQFSATPVLGNSSLTVTFTDLSTNTPTSWLWDFGDGDSTNATQKNPVHTFTTAGYYTVSLTATNGDGSDSETKENYITARCNLFIYGVLNPNPTAGTVFCYETNTLVITMVRNNVGNSPATEILVSASDGWSGRAPVTAMGPTGSQTVSILDPTIRTSEGTVTYTYKIDPDNVIPETDETTEQEKSILKNVRFNGYKGVQFWTGKEAPRTYLTFDHLHGNVVHSFGNSSYKSGKEGDAWPSLTWDWNQTQPAIPAGATVKAARLYIPYCWDHEQEVRNGNTTTTFNGVLLTPEHMEEDVSNFGPAYYDFYYGLITYNVTAQYIKNGFNTVTFTRNGWQFYPVGSLSPAGFTLAVVYEKSSESPKQIFINEGWDLLGASASAYGTTEEEATSYQEYTGMTIDMANATKANLTTFVPWGAPQQSGESGEGNLFVNDVQIGTRVWNYGASVEVWGENGLPQVAVDTRDILSYLNAGGTGNEIAIQSQMGSSPCMVAERSFLVVEYPFAPVALPGYTKLPTDPDHDGLYEDLNGNGRKDFNDIQVFYGNLAWIGANEPVTLFDFNGNGRIDFGDLQLLYSDM